MTEPGPAKELNELYIKIPLELGTTAQPLTIAQALRTVQGKLQQAESENAAFIAEQILLAAPSLSQSYDILYRLFFNVGQYSTLEKICRQWSINCPTDITAYERLSMSLRLQQKHHEAITVIQEALAIEADKPLLILQLATLHKEQGDFKQALALFNRVIELDPSVAEAYWNRADIYKGISESELQAMVARANRSDISSRQKAFFSYAAALGYELRLNYRKSFKCLQHGAAAKRKNSEYDHQREMATVSNILNTFSQNIIAATPSQTGSIAPIFICGLPRSGTTLVEQIISSHDDVTAGDELFELARATENILRKEKLSTPYPQWAADLNTQSWAAIGQEYLELTKRLQQTPRFTDKMPLNYKAIGIIRHALPEAKIINCMREPLDNLFGCYKQLFGEGLQFTYDLDELADTYIAYRETMQMWHDLYPGKILDVHYEELVHKQESVTRNVLDFLDLGWSEDCLNFHSNTRVVHTTSNSQVRKPLFSSSIGRWKNYEQELSGLRARVVKYL